MAHFRRLTWPKQVPGALYLLSMPGRREPLEQSWAEVARRCIMQFLCLAPDNEVREKASE